MVGCTVAGASSDGRPYSTDGLFLFRLVVAADSPILAASNIVALGARIVKLALGALLVASSLGLAAQESPDSVERFVHGLQAGGHTFGVAKQVSASADVGVLLDMLGDPLLAPHWPNVTVLVGLSVRDALVQPLIDFVEGRNSDAGSSLRVYRARTSAINALGYLVHEAGGNREAMQYLTRSVEPRIWAEREVSRVRADPDPRRLSLQLSTAAVSALALTGDPAAEATLFALMSSDNDRLREVAAAMLPEWEAVSRSGLAAYYEREPGDGPVAAGVGR